MGLSLSMHPAVNKTIKTVRVVAAANTASGTKVSSEEGWKVIWKWIAMPSTMSDHATTEPRIAARRMGKRRDMIVMFVEIVF
jgi:hypothetical protein